MRDAFVNFGLALPPILVLADLFVAVGEAFFVADLVALGEVFRFVTVGLAFFVFVPLQNKDLVFSLPLEPDALQRGAQPFLVVVDFFVGVAFLRGEAFLRGAARRFDEERRRPASAVFSLTSVITLVLSATLVT